MAINPYHTIEEINGIRCSIIEKGISSGRADFIKSILESSGFETVLITDENEKKTVGVTDITFNFIHALYSRKLLTSSKEIVTPAIWYQKNNMKVFTGNTDNSFFKYISESL
jgi:hypothetical protein